MSTKTEAFSRVKIDALLRDAGWNLTDGDCLYLVDTGQGEPYQAGCGNS